VTFNGITRAKSGDTLVKVKICGITNLEDAVRACEYGADLIGFIFVKGTPRVVVAGDVEKILSGISPDLRGKVDRVGLFRDEKPEVVEEAVASCGLNCVQLHGSLKDALGRELKIIKTFKVKESILPAGGFGVKDYIDADFFVFDTFHPEIAGGTGVRFDWEVIKKEKPHIEKPFFVAGGLTPENVSDAVKTVCPYGVDVSSGVENSPGKKDGKLLKEFIERKCKKSVNCPTKKDISAYSAENMFPRLLCPR